LFGEESAVYGAADGGSATLAKDISYKERVPQSGIEVSGKPDTLLLGTERMSKIFQNTFSPT
jgi:hypothetical protein